MKKKKDANQTPKVSVKNEIIQFLKTLRSNIVEQFETIEPKHRFQRKEWDYQAGTGGGEISLLQGEVFEKAAVNWSGVSGNMYPLNKTEGPFFATGVSLITHMSNPHAPTVHMNIRYIETGKRKWLGGGYDLTPMGHSYQEDTDHFHAVAKNALSPFGEELYTQFSKNAQEYFYIPHRKKERGVGGIFFDYYHTGDMKKDLKMWETVGITFLDTIMPIYRKRIHQIYTQEQKEIQLYHRAHYVEFNLLYDRGTKFGLESQGNPEAILCSMPPLAKWP